MSGRFAIVPAAWLDDPRIGLAEIGVLVILSAHADKQGWCYPNQQAIADQLKKSVTFVSRTIDALADAGFVEKRNIAKSGRKNAYRLLMDRFLADAELAPEQIELAPAQVQLAQAQNSNNTIRTIPLEQKDPPIPPKGGERVKIHSSWTDDGSGKVTMVEAIEAFESYWSLYPRKTNKSGARARFIAMLRKGTEHEAFDKGFDAYLRYCDKRNEPQFVAHFSTWLNQERWNDEHPEESKGTRQRGRPHVLSRAASVER
jgi:DNA-binding MarR family transcriptional regulator